ncbi:hypothetical protein MKW98_014190, partial [Papaver atlanticum]
MSGFPAARMVQGSSSRSSREEQRGEDRHIQQQGRIQEKGSKKIFKAAQDWVQWIEEN